MGGFQVGIDREYIEKLLEETGMIHFFYFFFFFLNFSFFLFILQEFAASTYKSSWVTESCICFAGLMRSLSHKPTN